MKWNENEESRRKKHDKISESKREKNVWFVVVVVGNGVFRAPFFLFSYNVALLTWIDGIRSHWIYKQTHTQALSRVSRCHLKFRMHSKQAKEKYVVPNSRDGSCNARAYLYICLHQRTCVCVCMCVFVMAGTAAFFRVAAAAAFFSRLFQSVVLFSDLKSFIDFCQQTVHPWQINTKQFTWFWIEFYSFFWIGFTQLWLCA